MPADHAPRHVLVVGSYVQDSVWRVAELPRVGETCQALGFSVGPGGKGFNQAVACARQNVACAFIGSLGEDDAGRGAQSLAQREGIRAHWQLHADSPTASAGIWVNARGENMIAVSFAANERLSVDFIQAQASVFQQAAVVLCQLENNLAAVQTAFAMGKAQGAIGILNPAPMRDDIHVSLLQQCNLLTPNETEFAALCRVILGESVDADALGAMDDARLHALCRRLHPHTVVITLGRYGCFVSHGSTQRGDADAFYRIAAERVSAVDSTGAGDAFNGGLAAGLLRFEGQAFATAVRYANRVAALSVERAGAAPAMPTHAEVESRFG